MGMIYVRTFGMKRRQRPPPSVVTSHPNSDPKPHSFLGDLGQNREKIDFGTKNSV
jgi:hypothetical protein